MLNISEIYKEILEINKALFELRFSPSNAKDKDFAHKVRSLKRKKADLKRQVTFSIRLNKMNALRSKI